jgi:MFS family permease
MALAGGLLLLMAPADLLALNAVSFALSAGLVLLMRAPGSAGPIAAPAETPLVTAALDGFRECLRIPRLRRFLLAAASASAFLALVNVGEVILARGPLGASATEYSLLVGIFGCGVVVGSFTTLGVADLERRFLAGLVVAACGLAGSAMAPHIWVAFVTFAVCGVSSGLLLVSGRALVHELAPPALVGSAFGVRDQLGAWAFATAFVVAPIVVGAAGVRVLFAVAAVGAILVASVLAPARGSAGERPSLAPTSP